MNIAEYTEYLCNILQNSLLEPHELSYRTQRIKEAEGISGSQISIVSDRYYSLAHEIKALKYLNQFGFVQAAADHNHESGCDYILNNKYQIECVCSTAGDSSTNGLASLCRANTTGKTIDYGKKEVILYSRFTSSLKEKRDFYQRHVEGRKISPNLPYIIFLGLGALAQEMCINPNTNGIEFTGILLGKGNPTVTINPESREIVRQGYAFRPYIEKWNHMPIDSAIFCNPEYRCVSGVLITGADLYEEYENCNTWLFTNPYAFKKITKKDFHNIVYWAADKNMMYRAYRNGKKKVSNK